MNIKKAIFERLFTAASSTPAIAATLIAGINASTPEEAQNAGHLIVGILQANVDSILSGAEPHIDDNANPDEVEIDWYLRFLDGAKFITDEDMQILWSKLLAGEINQSGSVSRQTISILSNLSKSDAKSFENICRFAVKDLGRGEGHGQHFLIMLEETVDKYKNYFGGRKTLHDLEHLGLISFNAVGYFFVSNRSMLEYHGSILDLKYDNQICYSFWELTPAGKIFIKMCDIEPVDDYYEFLKSVWAEYIT